MAEKIILEVDGVRYKLHKAKVFGSCLRCALHECCHKIRAYSICVALSGDYCYNFLPEKKKDVVSKK